MIKKYINVSIAMRSMASAAYTNPIPTVVVILAELNIALHSVVGVVQPYIPNIERVVTIWIIGTATEAAMIIFKRRLFVRCIFINIAE